MNNTEMKGGSSTTPWEYDVASRLTDIPGLLTDIRYLARGTTEKITYANGVRSFFTYDDERGWVDDIRHYKSGVTLQQSVYTRDAKGRITAVASTGAATESWAYGYDDIDRLISATSAYFDLTSSGRNTQQLVWSANFPERMRASDQDWLPQRR